MNVCTQFDKGKEEKRIQLDNCDKAYGDNKQLKRHFKSVHEGWKHYCNFCGKSFSYEQTLKRYRDGHNQKFKCNVCPKVYPFQDGLSRHVKNCHPEFRNIGYSNFQKVFEANSSKTEDNTVSERFMDCEICCFR